MKNPKNMTTKELIELADDIKGNMTTEWLKRYNKYFKPKFHLAKQS